MPDNQQTADIIVVGSGPTGAAAARSVADNWPDARILMIEAGPVISDPPGSHVINMPADQQEAAELASQGPRRGERYAPMTEAEWLQRIAGQPDGAMIRRPGLFAVGRGGLDGTGFPAAHAASNVGGMGAHWFAGCPRPARGERVPFIDAGLMEDALGAAERMMRVGTDQYDGSPVAAVLKSRLSALFDAGRPADRVVQTMPMAMARTAAGLRKTGSDVMLGDLLSQPDRFQLRPETICRHILTSGGRATGIEVVGAARDAVERIEAKSVVVAADALHTPQLLHASGIRPAALGHYLNEHFQVGLMVEMDTVLEIGGAGGVTWVPCVDASFPFSITITEAAPAMLPFGAASRDPSRPIIFISLFAASDLVFENCVTFSDSEKDWRGLPTILPHLAPTSADLERLEEAKAVVARVAAAIGKPLPGFKFIRPPYGSSLHYQGTVRMGESADGRSVCNAESRIWGFDNLYVAGNGVIPTVTATNPTLTSVALAILSGRSIAARHR